MKASPHSFSGLLVALLVACASTPTPEPVASGPTASPSAPTLTAGAGSNSTDRLTASPVATAAPDPLESVDEALVDRLVGSGLQEDEALFLALTALDARIVGPQQYLIVATFPTDSTAEIKVTLKLDQAGDPDADQPLSIRPASTADAFTFSLEYFVAYDVLPADVVDQLRGQAEVRSQALAFTGPTLPWLTTASETGGIAVAVEAVVKTFAMDGVKSFAEMADKWLTKRQGNDPTGPDAKSPFSKALGAIEAALTINDALGMSYEYREFMQTVDDLEDCARNPTNRVTRQEYERNPSEKQRVLDGIEAVRTEIKANLVVMYIGMLNETGSGLITKVPGLGYVVGAGTAWSMETLRQVNARMVDELRRAIPRCEWTLRIDYVAETDPGAVLSVGAGSLQRKGETKMVLKSGESEQLSASAPLNVDVTITMDFVDVKCHGEGVDRLTVSVAGTPGDGVLLLTTDWTGAIATQLVVQCGGQRDRFDLPLPWTPLDHPLITGFEIEARDGAIKAFEWPDPKHGNTTITLTLLREED